MTNKSKKVMNPFIIDPNHFGEMTVGQLVEIIVQDPSEFPKGMDTRICVGDIEGNLGVISDVQVTDHKRGDIVLSVDPHSGDEEYEGEFS